jgi:CRISPR-associated protein Csa1
LLKYSLRKGKILIREATQDMDREIQRFSNRPNASQKEQFLKNLLKVVRMESEITSAFIDYIIATNLEVNLDSEFSRIFPFQQEISLNATPLGLTAPVRPDFVYKRGEDVIIGEIKTGEPKEFHKLGVAAYAMAYEYEEEVPVNFGFVLNITFTEHRNVPIYKGSEAFVISEKYRRAFLELRDQKLNIIKNEIEPQRASNQNICNDCAYSNLC